MRYKDIFIAAMDYVLAPVVVTSEELEERLAPLYKRLKVPMGQLQAMTGIEERRWWEAGDSLAKRAAEAGRKALDAANVAANQVGALVYCGVCREDYEPATACDVAAQLKLNGETLVYDISNACLGVLNGMLDVANRIALGQIKAGVVVSCESARRIVEIAIDRMLKVQDMQTFTQSLATLTGGSGAVAVVLTQESLAPANSHQLLGGVAMAEPQHHDLCRWGMQGHDNGMASEYMRTDSVSVLKHGVALGLRTWKRFLQEMVWQEQSVDKVVCHQVGSAHQRTILETLNISGDKDFVTYPYLGNTGTVALPMSAAMAGEQEFLQKGDKVGWLGIGSGLNCMMLGVSW